MLDAALTQLDSDAFTGRDVVLVTTADLTDYLTNDYNINMTATWSFF